MSGTSALSRILSVRDKKRNTSKPRVDINNLFTIDEKSKRLSKEEEKKAQDIEAALLQLGIQNVPRERIEYALRSRSAHGDVKEALRLLMLYEDSIAGILRPFDRTVRMVGAENREKTTCFLDSLLFAMFAKSDVFEAILFNNFEDEPRKKLVAVMRLWVNLLRTGRLVTTDIIAKLQESLAECGWEDARKIRQQDASEAFAFITDKLQMPLLTLKADTYHAGGYDKDDHKFITERMLDVAIPENVPQGETITLEMCLEEYFNNRVEVKRHLQRRTTLSSNPGSASRHSSIDKGGATFVETTEIDPGRETPEPPANPQNPLQRPHLRERATSIFSERKVTYSEPETKPDGEINQAARQRAASVKKEVLMPAWQFLNLIPWYADKATPDNEPQVQQHFTSKRPMLGICLKRYNVNQRGFSYRLGTHVDIPLEMATPHFAEEETESDPTALHNVKLQLQSVVCHRGHSVEAGHYISFMRAGDVASTYGVRRNPNNDHNDSSNDIWLKFDDLASDRVVPVNIEAALKEESPYLLFYRVQPLDPEDKEATPPPYTNGPGSLDMVDEKLALLDPSPQGRTSFDAVDWQSRRGSGDAAVSPEEARGRMSYTGTRRGSLQPASPESVNGGSVQGGSVAGSIRTLDHVLTEPVTPLEERKSDPLSVSSVMSRDSANTRPTSGDSNLNSASEKRFSMSMSRLASKFSVQSKPANPDIVINEVADDGSPPQAPPPVLSIAPVHSIDTSTAFTSPALSQAPSRYDASDGVSTSGKHTKEKKRKFMSKSRRGSGQKNKAPDRECIVM